MQFRVPGRILCGTVNTPDLAASLADYSGQFGLVPVEEGRVSLDLARCWGAPAQAGRPYALLTAPGGAGGFFRLVQGSAMPAYRPLRTWGWAAFECTVADAFALHAGIDTLCFQVLGAPRLVPGFDTFIPFQVAGRAGEVLYLNTVLKPEMAELALPVATARVDHIFIAVLAAGDRTGALAFHTDGLGFQEGPTWTIPYSMINNSFGLPADHPTTMTMTRTGAIPACEIDHYPDSAGPRRSAPGELPPGNAMVSFAVASLDAIRAPFIAPAAIGHGPLYAGARSACVRGPSGECIELIEHAA